MMLLPPLDVGLPKPPEPLLTVVIPSYNCAPWLERSVASAGTLEGGDIQTIVVDDGSTDQTQEVLERLTREMPSLVVIRKPNGGLSSARNLGLSYAEGQYILFLDADDMLIPSDISPLVASASHMIRIGVEEISANEPTTIRAESKRETSGREYLANGFKDHSFYTSSCAYLYQTKWLREKALAFEEGLLHEDNLFTVQALLKADTVLVTPTLLYRYIKRPESITTSTSDDRLLVRIKSYARIASSLSAIANQDPSFDLRWKIQEVIDGAQRLGTLCSTRRGQLIALHTLLKFMLLYRGYGRHALQLQQWARVLRYMRYLAIHR
jgi:glycosyltransferase involved in cell wall biosynthesis